MQIICSKRYKKQSFPAGNKGSQFWAPHLIAPGEQGLLVSQQRLQNQSTQSITAHLVAFPADKRCFCL